VNSISIVTVNKNNAQGLRNTLISIRNQDWSHRQVIVVDGNSKDDSAKVIENFSDMIDVVKCDGGVGIYPAMNLGVSDAMGEWILFLNAGDCFYDNRVLSDVCEQLEGDLCYGWVQRVGSDHEHRPRKLDDFWRSSVICHQALFTRTALLRNRPYNVRYRIVADYEFNVWAFGSGLNFKYLDRAIAWLEPDGYSDRAELRRVWERFTIALKMFPERPIYRYYGRQFLGICLGFSRRRLETENDRQLV